jgi:hypothetical protein
MQGHFKGGSKKTNPIDGDTSKRKETVASVFLMGDLLADSAKERRQLQVCELRESGFKETKRNLLKYSKFQRYVYPKWEREEKEANN